MNSWNDSTVQLPEMLSSQLGSKSSRGHGTLNVGDFCASLSTTARLNRQKKKMSKGIDNLI